MTKKNWEVPELSSKKNLTSAAKVILTKRLDHTLKSVLSYLKNPNPKNLHSVRISLRRLRYPMELFIICFDRKEYLKFYKLISKLQDLTGAVRDLDIFKLNLKRFVKTKPDILSDLLKAMEVEQSSFSEKMKLELMKFTHGKAIKNFKKLITK